MWFTIYWYMRHILIWPVENPKFLSFPLPRFLFSVVPFNPYLRRLLPQFLSTFQSPASLFDFGVRLLLPSSLWRHQGKNYFFVFPFFWFLFWSIFSDLDCVRFFLIFQFNLTDLQFNLPDLSALCRVFNQLLFLFFFFFCDSYGLWFFLFLFSCFLFSDLWSCVRFLNPLMAESFTVFYNVQNFNSIFSCFYFNSINGWI